MNKKIIFIIIIIIGVLYFSFGTKKESFSQILRQIAPKDGFYMINFTSGGQLNAAAVTTVGCKEFSLGNRLPRDQKGWILQKVAGSEGVYLIKKATADECLHAGLDNQLMTYYYPGCNRSNLCGETETNYKNELDPYSTRSYWRFFLTNNNSVVIQNVETKGFISLINNRPRLTKTSSEMSALKLTNAL
jgi:hypothetical protein